MRELADGAVVRVASPRAGFWANDLKCALLRWPGVHDLTLLGMQNVASAVASLKPLTTSSLAGLTSLTFREVFQPGSVRKG
ncbi:hypothetical protein FOA52_015224 [Chlamydomonas sp. UWO 241]|nr:hypothetical protein FOA52_015224 [Chlamydomonas sp. UWO 241]